MKKRGNKRDKQIERVEVDKEEEGIESRKTRRAAVSGQVGVTQQKHGRHVNKQHSRSP